MSKIPMRVIPRPANHTRYIRTARGSGSSVMGGGTEGDYTYVCGNCRDILWKSVGADRAVVSVEDDEENFIAVVLVRDIVVKCKGCGAYNEMPN